MTALSEMGAIVYPWFPRFYAHPTTLAEMVDHTAGRMLDLFDVEIGVVKRLGEEERS